MSMRTLALFLMFSACAEDRPEVGAFDTSAIFDAGDDRALLRRITVAPPERLETPTSGNSMDDEAPCDAGEERWERTACIDVGFPGTPGWDESRESWVCPRCYIDLCGVSYYSKSLEREILPSMVQLPDCPNRRIPTEPRPRVRRQRAQ